MWSPGGFMRMGLRSLVAAAAVAATIPIVTVADSTLATARSEVQLQLGDLLFATGGTSRRRSRMTAPNRGPLADSS